MRGTKCVAGWSLLKEDELILFGRETLTFTFTFTLAYNTKRRNIRDGTLEIVASKR